MASLCIKRAAALLLPAALLSAIWAAGSARASPQAATPQPDANTPPSPAKHEEAAPPVVQDYAVHAQTTFVDQFHPGFHSAYSGPNSLDSGRRGNETFDLTIYAGVRPWRGGEVWADLEVDQGFGLNNTVGVAGFPSAEAYKVGAAAPYARLQRLFLRQSFGLGGDVQALDPDQNQLGGGVSADRVVVTIGKFSLPDVFDTNRYAHDQRNDFLNWTVIDGGAFDYAADAWGYSYGAALEWVQDWWTLRAGVFDGSQTPNSEHEAFPLGSQFQLVVEGEARYRLLGQDAKIKLLGFETRAKLGTFGQLAAFYTRNPGASNADAQIARHTRDKVGAEVNIEQPITRDLGAFLRASLADGRTEAYEFTDVDRSLAGGLSLGGDAWGRAHDTVGAAFVINTIGPARQRYFASGFLGVLVGDGKLLHMGPEQILETYYSLSLRRGVELTADYQLIDHPAYNVDRGPVSVFGLRLHAQF